MSAQREVQLPEASVISGTAEAERAQVGGVMGGLRRIGTFIASPRYRPFHFVIISFALILHLITHYATYLDATRSLVTDLPYFRLHVLHEMEFLLIIVYTGVVFGVKGGLMAVGISAITSVPFLFQADIIGYRAAPGEMRDSALQVSVMLLMGVLMVGLVEADKKRRQAVNTARAMQELDQLKTNFLSMASHELRTPISTIFGFADLLETSNPSE
jgi:signal transduction histidine kinase